MATLVPILRDHDLEAVRTIVTRHLPQVRVVATEEYLLRLAIASVIASCLKRKVVPTVEAEADRNAVKALYLKVMHNLSFIARTVEVKVVQLGDLKRSWWTRAACAQPTYRAMCKYPKVVTDFSRAILYRAGGITSVVAPSTDVESSSSTVVASGHGEDKKGMILSRDWPSRLATILRESKPDYTTLLIDADDSALLLALYAIQERFQKNRTEDIIIIPSMETWEGYSVRAIRRKESELTECFSRIEWANALFCLPMALCVGLPTMLMLQYYYNYTPLRTVLEAMRGIPTLIYQNKMVDTATLLQVVERFAKTEQAQLAAIYENVNKTSSESLRDHVDFRRVGWDQFRKDYYTLSKKVMPSELIQMRVMSYIGGLIELAIAYEGGELAPRVFKIIDAPLMQDMAAYLREVAKKAEVITLPNEGATLADESDGGEGCRKLNRLDRPWYTAY